MEIKVKPIRSTKVTVNSEEEYRAFVDFAHGINQPYDEIIEKVNERQKNHVRAPKVGSIEHKLMQQKLRGYPNFKNAIAKELVNTYNIAPELATKYAFSDEIDEQIMDDIAWAQHMGTEYWAEVIADEFLSNTHTCIDSEHAEQFLKEAHSKPTEEAKQRNKQAQALLHKLQR